MAKGLQRLFLKKVSMRWHSKGPLGCTRIITAFREAQVYSFEEIRMDKDPDKTGGKKSHFVPPREVINEVI
jgi:hypothetical protein